jgi:hypothetical protein
MASSSVGASRNCNINTHSHGSDWNHSPDCALDNIRSSDVLCGRGRVGHGTLGLLGSLRRHNSYTSYLPICLLTTAFLFPSSICFPNGNRTAGNAFFRRAVADRLEDYKQHQQAKNRRGMASVVRAIADEVHKSGGRFIDQNWRGMVRRMTGVLTNVHVYVA